MSKLQSIWKKWKAFGRAIGDVVGRMVMTLFYFVVVAPFGLGVRLLSDPLRLKPGMPRWERRESEEATLESARRAF